MKPPSEATKAKAKTIPDEVIQACNQLIANNWNGYSSTVKQDDLISLIVQNTKTSGTEKVFVPGWMDIQPVYMEAGWMVEYNNPDRGYGTGPRAFKFTKKQT